MWIAATLIPGLLTAARATVRVVSVQATPFDSEILEIAYEKACESL